MMKNKIMTGLILLLLAALAGCGERPSTIEHAAPTTSPLLAPPALITEEARLGIETEIGSTITPGAPATDLPEPRMAVTIDVTQNVRPISPLIYGISSGSAESLEQLRPSLNSWGGNPSTRYNWKLGDAWNSGSDWLYRNGSFDFDMETTGESASDNFVAISHAADAAVRLALPTLGWVAKDNNTDTCSFPLPDGTCGDADGATCKNPGQIADPYLANVPTDTDWVVEWVRHLTETRGYDIRFYAMDNEPELWGYTHYDVHPNCTTYSEILEKYLAYATAVRPLVPNAELTGPVTCCWQFYWGSAAGAADKARHGFRDFLPWFLDEVRRHDEAQGVRHLDVLDIHYYPEGLYNDIADTATAARRLRSTRSLWDPTYRDESWIAEPIALIPTMQGIINDHYPGLKLALSEWNFGAEETMNGGLAVADALGIFGREQLYMAAYWLFPPPGSPGFYAFKMYTNFNDDSGRFGDTSVLAQSDDQGIVSSYAALDSETGHLHLMLINKQPDEAMPLQVRLNHFNPHSLAWQYRYDEVNSDGIVASTIDNVNESFTILLPPYSITLLVMEEAP